MELYITDVGIKMQTRRSYNRSDIKLGKGRSRYNRPRYNFANQT